MKERAPELDDASPNDPGEQAQRLNEESVRRRLRYGVVAAAIAMALSAFAPEHEFGTSADGWLPLSWPWDRIATWQGLLLYTLTSAFLPVAAAAVALFLIRGRVGAGRAAVLAALSGMLILVRTPNGLAVTMLSVSVGGAAGTHFGNYNFYETLPTVRLVALVVVAAGARVLLDHPRLRAARWMTALAGGVILVDVLTPGLTGAMGLWHFVAGWDRDGGLGRWALIAAHGVMTVLFLLIGLLSLWSLRGGRVGAQLRSVRALTTGLCVTLPLVWWWSYGSVFSEEILRVEVTALEALLVTAGSALWFWGLVVLGSASLRALLGFEALRNPSRQLADVFE